MRVPQADVPKLPLSLHLTPPQPVKHSIEQSDDAVWFGTLKHELLTIGARALEAEGGGAEGAAGSGQPEGPQAAAAAGGRGIRGSAARGGGGADADDDDDSGELDLKASIFAARRKQADARAFYTGSAVTGRAIEIDFARLNGERFRRLVCGTSNDDLQRNFDATPLAEIKEVLLAHRGALYALYSYYCATGPSYERYAMGRAEYGQMCRDCELADSSSEARRRRETPARSPPASHCRSAAHSLPRLLCRRAAHPVFEDVP